MKKKLILAALLSSIVATANAASLIPKDGISILFVNGQEAESKIDANEIGTGFNQVVIRMDKNMASGSNSDVFTSKPYVVTFESNGSNVEIDHPVARSKRQAEIAFEGNNPQWTLVQGGTPIEYKQEVLKGKSGFFPYNDLDELMAEYNRERGISFDNGEILEKPVEAQAAVIQQTSAMAPAELPENLEQLKAWYLKASEEERKAFRRWMIDQE
jgi:uncharacterized protein YccT (UPF0319 family)